MAKKNSVNSGSKGDATYGPKTKMSTVAKVAGVSVESGRKGK